MKSTAQIFGLFGDQKYSDSAEFGLYTKRVETLLEIRLGCGFTARYARRNRKTVHLGARLRKPSKTVADLLGSHEGDIPRDGSRSIRPRDLGAVLYCCNLSGGVALIV